MSPSFVRPWLTYILDSLSLKLIYLPLFADASPIGPQHATSLLFLESRMTAMNESNRTTLSCQVECGTYIHFEPTLDHLYLAYPEQTLGIPVESCSAVSWIILGRSWSERGLEFLSRNNCSIESSNALCNSVS